MYGIGMQGADAAVAGRGAQLQRRPHRARRRRIEDAHELAGLGRAARPPRRSSRTTPSSPRRSSARAARGRPRSARPAAPPSPSARSSRSHPELAEQYGRRPLDGWDLLPVSDRQTRRRRGRRRRLPRPDGRRPLRDARPTTWCSTSFSYRRQGPPRRRRRPARTGSAHKLERRSSSCPAPDPLRRGAGPGRSSPSETGARARPRHRRSVDEDAAGHLGRHGPRPRRPSGFPAVMITLVSRHRCSRCSLRRSHRRDKLGRRGARGRLTEEDRRWASTCRSSPCWSSPSSSACVSCAGVAAARARSGRRRRSRRPTSAASCPAASRPSASRCASTWSR